MNDVATPTVTEVETPEVTAVPTPTVSDATKELESAGGYVPTFNELTRTVIYVVCGILGLLGAACAVASYTTSGPAWLTVASVVLGFAAPYVANMFGVAYNPLKMASR
jgi:hypothetical protein